MNIWRAYEVRKAVLSVLIRWEKQYWLKAPQLQSLKLDDFIWFQKEKELVLFTEAIAFYTIHKWILRRRNSTVLLVYSSTRVVFLCRNHRLQKQMPAFLEKPTSVSGFFGLFRPLFESSSNTRNNTSCIRILLNHISFAVHCRSTRINFSSTMINCRLSWIFPVFLYFPICGLPASGRRWPWWRLAFSIWWRIWILFEISS